MVALHHQLSVLLGTLEGVLKPREGKQLARDMEQIGTGAASEGDTVSLNAASFEQRDKGRVANTNTAGRKSRRNECMMS